MKNLSLNSQIIKILKELLIKVLILFNFDNDYIFDVEIRFQKLEFKLNIKETPLELIGGEKGIQ